MRKKLMFALTLGLAASSWVASAGVIEVSKPREIEPQSLVGVVVTATDPATALKSRPSTVDTGPFNGPQTLQLFVVAVFDRTKLGNQPFEQVTRFILPDGQVYESREHSLDPSNVGGVAGQISSPQAAPPLSLARLRRLSRAIPISMTERLRRESVFSQQTLPLSGTWITGHGLYGDWTVEVSALQNNQVVSTVRSSFMIENR